MLPHATSLVHVRPARNGTDCGPDCLAAIVIRPQLFGDRPSPMLVLVLPPTDVQAFRDEVIEGRDELTGMLNDNPDGMATWHWPTAYDPAEMHAHDSKMTDKYTRGRLAPEVPDESQLAGG
jgi:hypothetical protein